MILDATGSVTGSADRPRRFLVVGTAGGGKTTLATAVAKRLGLPHLELDRVRYGADGARFQMTSFWNR